MKPAWDKLMESYKGNPTSLVADVDCTAAGKPLCDKVGVRGYPTIKYGDPDDLEDYSGGRSEDDLKKFAAENLKPVCSVHNLDLCSGERKAELEGYLAMDPDELEEKILGLDKKIADAEAKYEAEVKKQTAIMKKAEKARDKAVKKIKDGGLNVMKSALSYKEKTGKSKLDL